MHRSQEETKKELTKIMQKCQEDLKNSLEMKIDSVESKINSVEEKIDVVEEKMGKIRSIPVPVSPVTLTASPFSVKMFTYEGKTNWETPPVTEHLYSNSLYNTRDLRFSQKNSKDYARLQMKTRLQKIGESLQDYVSEIHSITKKTTQQEGVDRL
ncbi:hypothetical protein TNCV_235741 [Trichonephila clavipes]|nr:hypothetical protein TNCV_235741 [Trichonephila clavipes]